MKQEYPFGPPQKTFKTTIELFGKEENLWTLKELLEYIKGQAEFYNLTQEQIDEILIYSEDRHYSVVVSLEQGEESVNPNYDEQFDRYIKEKEEWDDKQSEIEAAKQTLKKHGVTQL